MLHIATLEKDCVAARSVANGYRCPKMSQIVPFKKDVIASNRRIGPSEPEFCGGRQISVAMTSSASYKIR